jgi:hypothetical protein
VEGAARVILIRAHRRLRAGSSRPRG